MNLDSALKKITTGGHLSSNEAGHAMTNVMEGTASPLQLAAFLGALKMRGETVAEISGFVRALRDAAIPVYSHRTPLVDTCGTGGDSPKHGIPTFNISTAAAFIAAGAGVAIAKHGNRAMSSKCGSADVLEELGVNLTISAGAIGECIDEIGIGFMFAQAHHPAMKHATPVRKELGFRTVFNLAAPLANPAGVTAQVAGVADPRWVRPIAEVLKDLGSRHAIVAHAEDGLDEFSTCSVTHYIELKNGELTEKSLDPKELSCHCVEPGLLAGGDARENAAIIRRLLDVREGPAADIACLNAAAVIIVADMADDFAQAWALAQASIQSGAAKEKLDRLVEFTQNTKF